MRIYSLLIFLILSTCYTTISATKPISSKLVYSTASDNIKHPEFPGGESALYKYLSEQIKYPPILIKIEMEGSVDLQLTIDKDGKLKQAEITQGFDPDADDEVLRVINSMPEWTPASQNGDNVDYTMSLTVTFNLTEELKESYNNNTPVAKQEGKENKVETSEPTKEDSTNESKTSHDPLNTDPQFPGGQNGLDTYLKANLKYPKRAIEYGIEGRVIFDIEVTEEGKIENIRLYKGIFQDCNEEAFYLIKKMPDWKPALKDGKPIKKRVILPIPFELPK